MSRKKTVWLKVPCRGPGCKTVFYICHSCYRGQAYCGDGCRKKARMLQRRRANKKHQDSPEGKLDHRDHQRVYRKKYPRRVTDHTSPRRDQSGSIAKPVTEAKTKPREARKIRVWDPRARFRGAGLSFTSFAGCAGVRD